MIIKLHPYVSTRIWGGENLARIKGINHQGELPIGETWEISTHKEGASKIASSNESLASKYNLNFLVKFLDTADVLSVQVHPNDEYSKKYENDNGKNECWLVLDAKTDAGIYLGFKSNTNKAILKETLNNKGPIDQCLNFYKVKKGDFFFVPAGTIHAIGPGITLVEIQQSSGVTYRVWDWNRVDKNGKGRELHVEKSFDVLEDDPQKNSLEYFKYKQGLLDNEEGKTLLTKDKNFEVELISIAPNENVSLNLDSKNVYGFILLEGKIKLANVEVKPFESYLIEKLNQVEVYSLGYSKILLVK